MRKSSRYAAIGFVVSKFVLPIAKRRAKRSAKRKARGAVTGTADAVRRHPARTSVAVGSALGALGWLASRSRDSSRTSRGDDE